MSSTMGQLGGLRQVPQKSLFAPRNTPPPWLIILYTFSLPSTCDFPPSSVQHAIYFRAFGLRIRPCRVGGIGRQPRFHHLQSGRRLWCRPVPRQGRKVWRSRRFVLLPVAGFLPGFLVSARRSGRDHRLGSPVQQELHPSRLQRIRRHHLPALNLRPRHNAPPYWCPGNDVTLPREAGMGRPRWPRLRFVQTRAESP
jgi:hypothetical protein